MSGKAQSGSKRPRKDGLPEHVALFPPIHVSHASVAGPGPRAPPRNKMALYESIAIPSKRHAPGPQPTQSGSSQFLGSTSGPQSSQAPVDTAKASGSFQAYASKFSYAPYAAKRQQLMLQPQQSGNNNNNNVLTSSMPDWSALSNDRPKQMPAVTASSSGSIQELPPSLLRNRQASSPASSSFRGGPGHGMNPGAGYAPWGASPGSMTDYSNTEGGPSEGDQWAFWALQQQQRQQQQQQQQQRQEQHRHPQGGDLHEGQQTKLYHHEDPSQSESQGPVQSHLRGGLPPSPSMPPSPNMPISPSGMGPTFQSPAVDPLSAKQSRLNRSLKHRQKRELRRAGGSARSASGACASGAVSGALSCGVSGAVSGSVAASGEGEEVEKRGADRESGDRLGEAEGRHARQGRGVYDREKGFAEGEGEEEDGCAVGFSGDERRRGAQPHQKEAGRAVEERRRIDSLLAEAELQIRSSQSVPSTRAEGDSPKYRDGDFAVPAARGTAGRGESGAVQRNGPSSSQDKKEVSPLRLGPRPSDGVPLKRNASGNVSRGSSAGRPGAYQGIPPPVPNDWDTSVVPAGPAAKDSHTTKVLSQEVQPNKSPARRVVSERAQEQVQGTGSLTGVRGGAGEVLGGEASEGRGFRSWQAEGRRLPSHSGRAEQGREEERGRGEEEVEREREEEDKERGRSEEDGEVPSFQEGAGDEERSRAAVHPELASKDLRRYLPLRKRLQGLVSVGSPGESNKEAGMGRMRSEGESEGGEEEGERDGESEGESRSTGEVPIGIAQRRKGPKAVRPAGVVGPSSIGAPHPTPREVMALTGQKQFWDVRKEIIRQQRIFSAQLQDLHKLIKVQKELWPSSESGSPGTTSGGQGSPGDCRVPASPSALPQVGPVLSLPPPPTHVWALEAAPAGVSDSQHPEPSQQKSTFTPGVANPRDQRRPTPADRSRLQVQSQAGSQQRSESEGSESGGTIPISVLQQQMYEDQRLKAQMLKEQKRTKGVQLGVGGSRGAFRAGEEVEADEASVAPGRAGGVVAKGRPLGYRTGSTTRGSEGGPPGLAASVAEGGGGGGAPQKSRRRGRGRGCAEEDGADSDTSSGTETRGVSSRGVSAHSRGSKEEAGGLSIAKAFQRRSRGSGFKPFAEKGLGATEPSAKTNGCLSTMEPSMRTNGCFSTNERTRSRGGSSEDAQTLEQSANTGHTTGAPGGAPAPASELEAAMQGFRATAGAPGAALGGLPLGLQAVPGAQHALEGVWRDAQRFMASQTLTGAPLPSMAAGLAAHHAAAGGALRGWMPGSVPGVSGLPAQGLLPLGLGSMGASAEGGEPQGLPLGASAAYRQAAGMGVAEGALPGGTVGVGGDAGMAGAAQRLRYSEEQRRALQAMGYGAAHAPTSASGLLHARALQSGAPGAHLSHALYSGMLEQQQQGAAQGLTAAQRAAWQEAGGVPAFSGLGGVPAAFQVTAGGAGIAAEAGAGAGMSAEARAWAKAMYEGGQPAHLASAGAAVGSQTPAAQIAGVGASWGLPHGEHGLPGTSNAGAVSMGMSMQGLPGMPGMPGDGLGLRKGEAVPGMMGSLTGTPMEGSLDPPSLAAGGQFRDSQLHHQHTAARTPWMAAQGAPELRQSPAPGTLSQWGLSATQGAAAAGMQGYALGGAGVGTEDTALLMHQQQQQQMVLRHQQLMREHQELQQQMMLHQQQWQEQQRKLQQQGQGSKRVGASGTGSDFSARAYHTPEELQGGRDVAGLASKEGAPWASHESARSMAGVMMMGQRGEGGAWPGGPHAPSMAALQLMHQEQQQRLLQGRTAAPGMYKAA